LSREFQDGSRFIDPNHINPENATRYPAAREVVTYSEYEGDIIHNLPVHL
jgi:hypothetical protein